LTANRAAGATATLKKPVRLAEFDGTPERWLPGSPQAWTPAPALGMRKSRDKIAAGRKPARGGRARAECCTGEHRTMADTQSNIAELDSQIADVRENLRELVEQAAAYSGAADEDLASQRIAEQEALLDRLTKERDALTKAG
jgi:ribosome-binding protein aMBF1 (putative translation factor)